MVHTAKLFGYREKFTATTLEPVNEKDRAAFQEIAKSALQAAMCHRSALLTQVFAVTESDAMTMLTYNELASGEEVVSRYWNNNWIVFYYLDCIHTLAIQSLRGDEALTFPVTERWGDWSVNFQTLTWHFNPASLSLNPPTESALAPFPNHFPPLCQDTVPQLNSTEIVAHVEKNFGDFLHLIATDAGRWITDLSNYVQNGLLTFGAVVDDNRPGILAHFPSTPSPELFCQSLSPDIKASYSASGRVDFSFRKTSNVKVTIDFGLHIPNNNGIRLRTAYLCQSLHLRDDCSDVRDMVYIDLVGFHLEGTFPKDPTTHPKPVFLFIPPLHTKLIHSLHCVCYPFPQSLFYWSHDPHGREKIDEEDWERLGIPKLSVQELIGTYWGDEEYSTIQEVFCWKDYDLDGKQYVHDHRYPKLKLGDPHDTTRIQELESSKSDSEPEAPPLPCR
ncbi:hypothetical protein PQX77_019366 [Marasmius sp. AFHP31]|nr:hypothetical protein PQX77_019366 [Marasmius sp. AFHP31]